jgi:hypothetical protein
MCADVKLGEGLYVMMIASRCVYGRVLARGDQNSTMVSTTSVEIEKSVRV